MLLAKVTLHLPSAQRIAGIIIWLLGLGFSMALIQVNEMRGDEFLSYLHSNPRFTLPEIIQHVQGGADHSYTHAVLLNLAFRLFGYTIEVQRYCSWVCWLAGIALLYRMLNNISERRLPEWAMAFIAFSNMGFFLASDGRFYSLLFVCGIAWVGVLLSARPSLWLLLLLNLLGLLTSPNFVLLQLVAIPACLLSKKITWSRQWLLLLAATGFANVLYFTVCKIPYFHQYFSAGFTTPVPFNWQAVQTALDIPFRWMLLLHLPGATPVIDAMLNLLLLVVVGWVYRKSIRTVYKQFNANQQLIMWMGIGAMVLFVLHLAAYGVLGWPTWSFRYFGILSCWGAAAIIVFVARSPRGWVTVLFIGAVLRLAMVEWPKIPERYAERQQLKQAAQQLINQPKPILFVEDLTNPKPVFSWLGNMYALYPESRTKLFFKPDPANPERIAYFQRIGDWHYAIGLEFAQPDSTRYQVYHQRP